MDENKPIENRHIYRLGISFVGALPWRRLGMRYRDGRLLGRLRTLHRDRCIAANVYRSTQHRARSSM